MPTAPRPLLDDASLVASAFVNLFGRANVARVGRDEQASTAAARIVGVHAYGVEHALGWVPGPTDAERVSRVDWPTGPPDAGPEGAIAELAPPCSGGTRSEAVFDPEALGHVVDLAARTDAGVILLRQDLANYQRVVAAAAGVAASRRRDPAVAGRAIWPRRCATPPVSRVSSSSTSAARRSGAVRDRR